MEYNLGVAGKVWVGTSGWNYPHWKEVFYPSDLPSRSWLPFYAKHFPAVEVNYSFYRLPKPETYRKWVEQTPPDFIFSLKASRFITHVKRIKDVKSPLNIFLANAWVLGGKLGPVLFQLPPSFRQDLGRLEGFLKILPKDLRFAFEFRHPSWFGEETYTLLRRYNAALIASDTPRYPYAEVQTADFFYLRLHGHEVIYASSYSDAQLREYAWKIGNWRKAGDVFVFFDNDFSGFALENARQLLKLLS